MGGLRPPRHLAFPWSRSGRCTPVCQLAFPSEEEAKSCWRSHEEPPWLAFGRAYQALVRRHGTGPRRAGRAGLRPAGAGVSSRTSMRTMTHCRREACRLEQSPITKSGHRGIHRFLCSAVDVFRREHGIPCRIK
jgi:hypothetical protein